MRAHVKSSGQVSIFVVVFTTLLITIITVSFIRLMVQDQQQATEFDLSQRAYDSAQAGVEDAKRAIMRYQSICANSDEATCKAAEALLNSPDCNKALEGLVDVNTSSNGEVPVKEASGNALDQAYTCVIVNTKTPEYKNRLVQGTSTIVPLVGASEFDTIKIEWFDSKDLSTDGGSLNVPDFSAGAPLLGRPNWNDPLSPNRPSIIRAQVIEYAKSGFNLSDLDNNSSSATNNTLFLYPSNIINTTNKIDAIDIRKSPVKSPILIHCNPDFTTSNYACSATIQLANTIDSGHAAYLRLGSVYKDSDFRVSLLSSSSPVKFNDVQPAIDSTGRAGDYFRRVDANVEFINQGFNYPDAEINISGDFCKDMFVTNNSDDYINGCSSSP